MHIVVVSPHRDDAAFSLGLAIESWLDAGHKLSVLNCFTQSEYAPYSDVESLHPHDRVSFVSALRRREDLAWNKLLGSRVNFHDLDLLDAPLRLVCPVEEVLTVEIRPGDRAVARVGGALSKLARNVAPGELAWAVPLAVGRHIDHRVPRQARLETFVDPATPVAFYEDLPYVARTGAAETARPLAEATGLDLRPVFTTLCHPDASGAVQRKIRIAECYDSQVDSETVTLIAEYARTLGGRERLWGNPAWRGSELCRCEETPG